MNNRPKTLATQERSTNKSSRMGGAFRDAEPAKRWLTAIFLVLGAALRLFPIWFGLS